MITLSQLFIKIDEIANSCVSFFDSISSNVPRLKQKLDNLASGQTMTEAEIAEAQKDLDAIQEGLLRASKQFELINPMATSPESNEQPSAPVDLPESIEDVEIELPIDVIENDTVGIPGIPSMDFDV